MKHNLIAISGKINSGKDTLADIINYLSFQKNTKSLMTFDVYISSSLNPDYQYKKFADKLKDIVCILIGCTREQLEDREFKEKELGEEWWKYSVTSQYETLYYNTYDEALKAFGNFYAPVLIKLTPRKLLQLLGTECGRNIIHPNIWVNALMSTYKANIITNVGIEYNPQKPTRRFPNWIITDMRFPNELKAVKDRGGLTIRIERDYVDRGGVEDPKHQHPSETALDKASFDVTIINDGTIEDLIEKVKQLNIL